jgi:hypothetical protein
MKVNMLELEFVVYKDYRSIRFESHPVGVLGLHCSWYLVSHAKWCHLPYFGVYGRLHYDQPMITENRQLVTNEHVEVQDRRKITDHFRGTYRIYPNVIKENRGMSICNLLDLQTLAPQPNIPRNLPNHCDQRLPH